jgi:hypothetical protein
MGERSAPREVMEVVYERDGRGEALLGWVDSEAQYRVESSLRT